MVMSYLAVFSLLLVLPTGVQGQQTPPEPGNEMANTDSNQRLQERTNMKALLVSTTSLLESLTIQVALLARQIVEVKQENMELKDQLKNVTDKGNLKVVFMATRSTPLNVLANTPITFDYEITSVGDGFSKNTGKFTAPVKGAYWFAFNGVKGSTGQCWLRMMRNDRGVCSSYSNAGMVGLTAALVLEVGDVVQVNLPGHGYSLYSHNDDNRMITFSGALIFPL